MVSTKNVVTGAALLWGALLFFSSPASADIFKFSYTSFGGGPSFSGHGGFITGNSASPFLVTDVTGFAIDGDIGSKIVGISSFASADNRLLFPQSPHTDFSGISFTTLRDGNFNLYFNTGEFTGYGLIWSVADPGGTGSGFQVRFSVTPLPPALPLFAGALGLLGLLVWRNRQNRAVGSGGTASAHA